MKTIPPLQLTRAFRFRRTFLVALAGCLAAGLASHAAAPPSLQLIPQAHWPAWQGKWPAWPRGRANDVKVVGNYAYAALGAGGLAVFDVSNPTNSVQVGGYNTSGYAAGVAVSGNYAYVADGYAGLQVIDVSNPTRCVRVGGYDTSGYARDVTVSGNYAYVADDTAGLQVIEVSNPANCVRVGGYVTIGSARGVAVSGNYAYVADYDAGLQVIDVSNPTNCVRVGGHDTSGSAYGVAVVAGRIYVADGEAGLVVLPTLPTVQFTVRVNATPGVPFILQAATNLSAPNPWTPLLTTNVSAMPFDYVDFDVKLSEKPQKFYRVRQP